MIKQNNLQKRRSVLGGLRVELMFLVHRVNGSGIMVELGDVHKLCKNDIPMKVFR